MIQSNPLTQFTSQAFSNPLLNTNNRNKDIPVTQNFNKKEHEDNNNFLRSTINSKISKKSDYLSPKKSLTSWRKKDIHEVRDTIYNLNFQFKLTSDQKSFISYPNNQFQTNDVDMYNLLTYMNENVSEWDNVVKNDTINCYKKNISGSKSILIKAVSHIKNFSSEEIFQAIFDIKKRMSWDFLFKDIKIVIPETENTNEIIYMALQVSRILILFILVSCVYCPK